MFSFLGVIAFIYFEVVLVIFFWMFIPIFGEGDSQFDEHIFQMAGSTTN